MLGFVFAASKRQVSPEQAGEIVAAVRASGQNSLMVGLFVNEHPERIAAIAEQCGLDVIQLSGDEPAEILDELPELPIIKAIRLAGNDTESFWLELPPERATLLIDAHVPGSYGGTGNMADWAGAAALSARRRVMLAGGLHPRNVGAAIAQVRPWGVDVSSGVEREGQKNSDLIRHFIVQARAAGKSAAR